MIYTSYSDIIKDFKNFKRVDRTSFNRYDTPTALYFRPFFYFSENNGFLSIAGMDFTKDSISDTEFSFMNDWDTEAARKNRFSNTAFDYLILNDETERAIQLKRFVKLLSEISQNSPWYFKEISGIDSALERKQFDKEFKIEEERKQLTIKCLEDAYDQRIGTLLDLYRSICYSYVLKKEIIPANLRRFNMCVLIFEATMLGRTGFLGDKNSKVQIPNSTVDYYIGNTKLIEFRNCEFDQNSSKSGYSTLNNDEPLQPKYDIVINYDDAYEERYNPIMQAVITDFLSIDLNAKRDSNDLLNVHGAVEKIDSKNGFNWINTDNSGRRYWVAVGNGNFQSGPLNSEERTTALSAGSDGDKEIYDSKFENNSSIDKDNPTLVTPEKSHLFNKGTSLTGLGGLNLLEGTGFDTMVDTVKPVLKNLGGVGKNMLEGAASQVINTGRGLAREGLKKLYLGNINGIGMSLADITNTTQKLLGGDLIGVATDIIGASTKKENINNSKETSEQTKPSKEISVSGMINPELAKKKLPQYEERKTSFLNIQNTGKSLYNNI